MTNAFTLDREHTLAPVSVDRTGAGILHGAVTTALSDRGRGTSTEQSGRTSIFRYGALTTALPAG